MLSEPPFGGAGEGNSPPRFNAPKGGNAVLTQVYRSYMAAANDCFNAPKGGNAVLTVQEEVTPTSTPVIVSMPRRAVMLF